jgi:hypothetical protein
MLLSTFKIQRSEDWESQLVRHLIILQQKLYLTETQICIYI